MTPSTTSRARTPPSGSGPRRAVAAGLISARAMLLAAAIALAIAFAWSACT